MTQHPAGAEGPQNGGVEQHQNFMPDFTPIDQDASHDMEMPKGSERSPVVRMIYGNGQPTEKVDLFWNGLLDAGLLCFFLIILPWGALWMANVIIALFDPLEETIKGPVKARVRVIGYTLFLLLILCWPVALCLNVVGLFGLAVGWPLFLLAYLRPFDDQHYNDWRKVEGHSAPAELAQV